MNRTGQVKDGLLFQCFVDNNVRFCYALLVVFTGAFLFRRKSPKAIQRKRDKASLYGILSVSAGYALVWSIHRPMFSPLADFGFIIECILAVVTGILSIGSVWIVIASVRTLGKQWTVAAQLVESHKLITGGPYQYIRNPIYTGMLGMMIATGLAMSTWYVLILATILGWIGTIIRIRSEEKLLRVKFGEEFVQYTQKVPALLPKLF